MLPASRMHRRVWRWLTGLLACAVACSVCAGAASAASRTYTVDPDFDEGVLDGVTHDIVHDQLQLNPQLTTFPFAWIANAGEGTVSKVDTRTGLEVARYRIGPGGAAESPSRTAVDRFGNCWVANRAFGIQPSVVQILIEGGIDRNGNSTIETSSDLNHDGVCDDPGEVLPWGQDEAVARRYLVGNVNSIARALTLDRAGFIWVGLWSDRRVLKVDPHLSVVTYAPLANAKPPELASVATGTTYGLATAPNGRLYLATLGATVWEIDPGAASGGTDPPRVLQSQNHGGTNYGIAADGSGIVWLADYGADRCIRWDPSLGAGGFTATASGVANPRGITVDFDGNIWMAIDSQSKVQKYAPTAPPTLLFTVAAGGAVSPIGVGVAEDGHIIAVGQSSDSWGKIDVGTGATIVTGGPQLVGDAPYTYSDFTGSLSRIIGRQGFWTVVYDSGIPGDEWGMVSWHDLLPDLTAITVNVRAADALGDLPGRIYQPVANGVEFSGLFGRYIQIRVLFTSDRQDLESPVLYDLTVRDRYSFPNCPRSAGFWMQQCEQKDNGSVKYSAAQMTLIAERAAQWSSFFDWAPGTDFAMFCATVGPPTPMDSRMQAHRQFAALLANVATGDLEFIAGNGDTVSLNPHTAIACDGLSSTTIEDLIHEVDSLLAWLEPLWIPDGIDAPPSEGDIGDVNTAEGDPPKPHQDPEVREAYGRIAACLDALNNGLGIPGSVCVNTIPEPGEPEERRWVGPSGMRPQGVALGMPTPNPFRAATRLAFEVGGAGGHVNLAVYDIAGRRVRVLANGFRAAGRHEVRWDGRDESGLRMRTGAYFVRGTIAGRSIGTRVMFVR